MLRPKESLRSVLEGRARPLVVMGVTSLVGLVAILPAADEYITLRERAQEAETGLEEARQQVEQLPWLSTTAAEIDQNLSDLQSRAVAESQLNDLRGWLAETARAAGCHMRKSEPQSAQVRAWRAEDDPFHPPAKTAENPETPYDLTTQSIRLTLSGTLAEVREFLEQLEAQEHLLHTRRFRLRPEDQSGQEVVLELEIMLFHLGPRPAEPTA